MPGAVPQALLMSPRWGLPGRYTGFINVAPLGLAPGHRCIGFFLSGELNNVPKKTYPFIHIDDANQCPR